MESSTCRLLSAWLEQNKLNFNENETQTTVLSPHHFLQYCTLEYNQILGRLYETVSSCYKTNEHTYENYTNVCKVINRLLLPSYTEIKIPEEIKTELLRLSTSVE